MAGYTLFKWVYLIISLGVIALGFRGRDRSTRLMVITGILGAVSSAAYLLRGMVPGWILIGTAGSITIAAILWGIHIARTTRLPRPLP